MSTINEAAVLRFYLDTQEYSDRLTAIEAQAASNLATQKSEVATAIAQVNLTQSQTITALTLEVNNLKTNLIDSITATQTELIDRADQLAQGVTDIAVQLTQDKATFTQEIQDALDYLKDDASVASALRTPRKIQGVDFDGTQDISLPTFTTQTDGLVPKRVGSTTTNYLCEDGTWVVPPDTTYALLTKASAEDGTATTANTISAQVLKDAILHHTPIVTDVAGNAGTATKLQTPRTVGGVLFDGTAAINLPGVNTTGNQNTTGNANTASKLATPVQINGVNFDGSTGFDIPTFTASKSGAVPAAGADTTKYLRSDGTWAIPAETQYTVMTATTANAGTDTTAQVISPSVLKQAIKTHAPAAGGGGGMNFAAKVEIELETVFDFVSGIYSTLNHILSVSNQANIASAVIDGNGILCLTFNTPISNPNLIVTTKSEVTTVTYGDVGYYYLTSQPDGNFSHIVSSYMTYGIFQYAEYGYANTDTQLYISCNLSIDIDNGNIYQILSTFPPRFNLGIIDA